MSAFGLKPNFNNKEEYLSWRRVWASFWNEHKQEKRYLVDAYNSSIAENKPAAQRKLWQHSIMGKKLMTLLSEALIRRDNIVKAMDDLRKQNAQFPLTLENCRNIVFHFNKKSLEFSFLPAWIVKAKGQTFYVKHVSCNVPWSTKETPDNPSTKGSIVIKRGNLHFNAEGEVTISN